MSSEAIAIIIAASIGAFGTVVAGIISLIISVKGMTKKNGEDHGKVQDKLEYLREDIAEIKNDVNLVGTKIDEHVTWHLDH